MSSHVVDVINIWLTVEVDVRGLALFICPVCKSVRGSYTSTISLPSIILVSMNCSLLEYFISASLFLFSPV